MAASPFLAAFLSSRCSSLASIQMCRGPVTCSISGAWVGSSVQQLTPQPKTLLGHACLVSRRPTCMCLLHPMYVCMYVCICMYVCTKARRVAMQTVPSLPSSRTFFYHPRLFKIVTSANSSICAALPSPQNHTNLAGFSTATHGKLQAYNFDVSP